MTGSSRREPAHLIEAMEGLPEFELPTSGPRRQSSGQGSPGRLDVHDEASPVDARIGGLVRRQQHVRTRSVVDGAAPRGVAGQTPARQPRVSQGRGPAPPVDRGGDRREPLLSQLGWRSLVHGDRRSSRRGLYGPQPPCARRRRNVEGGIDPQRREEGGGGGRRGRRRPRKGARSRPGGRGRQP